MKIGEGHVKQVENPGSFFTGRWVPFFLKLILRECSLKEIVLGLMKEWCVSVGKARYVVCKDEMGQIQAFHNVCRHHAAAVASGSGCTKSFVCPYHVSPSQCQNF